MPDFDITMPVTLTFRVEAADAEKAAWAMRHAFDSRHAGDPMAGLSMSFGMSALQRSWFAALTRTTGKPSRSKPSKKLILRLTPLP